MEGGEKKEKNIYLQGMHEIIKIKASYITSNFLCLESCSRSLTRQVHGLRGSDAFTETGLVGAQGVESPMILFYRLLKMV